MLLTILSMLLLISYIVYAMSVIKAVPWSISDTYYQLEKRFRPKWLFQLAMIAPAMLLLPAWLDCSPSNIQFLSFLSCGGLVFVGAAPCFKLDLDGSVHYTATAVCGLSAILWMCLVGVCYIPLVCFMAAGYLIYRYNKPMFWIECAAFVSTYLSVLTTIL